MSTKKATHDQKKYCRCGCGEEIKEKPWSKYRNQLFITGHNVPIVNKVSLIDKIKDNRKGQTGFLATKVIANIRHDAIKAGYEWFLDDVFVYYKMIGDCFYCGKLSGWPNGRNGIDRVDSKIGYYPKNCVSCCKQCNRAKSDQTQNEFYEWIERIKNHLELKRDS